MIIQVVNCFLKSAGGGLPGPHRYWRINITAVNSGNIAGLCGLQLYTTPFGANVAYGGTASADSTFGAGFTAANGFQDLPRDGDHVWASANSALPHWLAYDFGAGNDKEILSVGMTGRDSAGTNQPPTAFDVQYSDDGSNWTTAWSQTGFSWTTFAFKRSTHPLATSSYTGSPHGSHAYWRLAVCAVQTPANAACCAELEIRATPSGTDQCTGGTASTDGTFSGSFPASNAFDNNVSTLWANNDKGSDNYGWLKYQFASPVSAAEFRFTARNDTSPSSTPSAMQLQWSDDNTTWTTAWGTGGQSWSLGQARNYTDPNYV